MNSDASGLSPRDQAENEARPEVEAYAEWLPRLVSSAKGMTLGCQIRGDDHLAFMGLQFHAKQIHHAEGVLALADHADTALVARSMLEGLALWKWACAEPSRALRWRMYSAITDWRLMGELTRRGAHLDDEARGAIASRLIELGDDFLNSDARDRKAQGRELQKDPWVSRWYQPQLRQVFAAVGEEALYTGQYQSMSEWHHWSPGGIGPRATMEQDTLGFRPRSLMMQSMAMSVAFTCLAETTLLLARHLAGTDVTSVASVITACAADERLHASRRA